MSLLMRRFSAFLAGLVVVFAIAPTSAMVAHTLDMPTVPLATNQVVSNINDSGPGSLRQIIATAKAGDIITFAQALSGTIALTSGEILISKDLIILGPGRSLLTLSGNQTNRIFTVAAGTTVTLSELSFAQGYVDRAQGGAILNHGTLTLTNASIYDNTAFGGLGGGIYNNGGRLNLINVDVQGNITENAGGGIYNDSGLLEISQSAIYGNMNSGVVNTGSMIVRDSAIYSNTSSFGGGVRNSGWLTLTNTLIYNNVVNTDGNGGGIYSTGSLFVQDSAIYSNTLPRERRYCCSGGGIYTSGRSKLLHSRIYSNVASYGGGISNEGQLDLADSQIFNNDAAGPSTGGIPSGLGGGVLNNGETTVRSSEVYSNTSQSGGGIFNFGILYLTNSAVYLNHATYGGGLEHNANSPATTSMLTNTTLSGNNAITGGGIHIDYGTEILSSTIALNNVTISKNDGGGIVSAEPRIVTIANSIIAFNIGGNCTTMLFSHGYNLEDGNTCGLTATGDIISTDPLLDPLTTAKGTAIYRLMPESPAIDAGNPATADNGLGACARSDQRGVSRPIGSACDIGAYEYGRTAYLPIITR